MLILWDFEITWDRPLKSIAYHVTYTSVHFYDFRKWFSKIQTVQLDFYEKETPCLIFGREFSHLAVDDQSSLTSHDLQCTIVTDKRTWWEFSIKVRWRHSLYLFLCSHLIGIFFFYLFKNWISRNFMPYINPYTPLPNISSSPSVRNASRTGGLPLRT